LRPGEPKSWSKAPKSSKFYHEQQINS
jgi:hypothetical protein